MVTFKFKKGLEFVDVDMDWRPSDEREFVKFITTAPIETLKKVGFGLWNIDEDSGEEHYLFPGEWFDDIPEDFPVYTISNRLETWKKDKMDDDTRFGCLAYGFVRDVQESLLKIV